MRQLGPRDEHATCGPMQAELDLLIRAALLANLPRSGAVWPEPDRQEWLLFAETLFKLV